MTRKQEKNYKQAQDKSKLQEAMLLQLRHKKQVGAIAEHEEQELKDRLISEIEDEKKEKMRIKQAQVEK